MVVKSLFSWKFNFTYFAADPFFFDSVGGFTAKKVPKVENKTLT
jgi:hypothetical protein